MIEILKKKRIDEIQRRATGPIRRDFVKGISPLLVTAFH
jgi:hypothetical protein